MTFDEAKKRLTDLKYAKQRVLAIKRRIDELCGIQSSLGRVGKSTSPGSPVMRAILRMEKEQLNLSEALNEVFAIEDDLAEALDCLSPLEKEIIIGYYLDCDTHEKLAQRFYFAERHVQRLKNKATAKIANHMSKKTDEW